MSKFVEKSNFVCRLNQRKSRQVECYIQSSTRFGYVHFKLLISSVLRRVLWAGERSNAKPVGGWEVKGSRMEDINQTTWKKKKQRESVYHAAVHLVATKPSPWLLESAGTSQVISHAGVRLCKNKRKCKVCTNDFSLFGVLFPFHCFLKMH